MIYFYFYNNNMGIGDWGLGGWGQTQKPKTQNPNPKNPPQIKKNKKIININFYLIK